MRSEKGAQTFTALTADLLPQRCGRSVAHVPFGAPLSLLGRSRLHAAGCSARKTQQAAHPAPRPCVPALPHPPPRVSVLAASHATQHSNVSLNVNCTSQLSNCPLPYDAVWLPGANFTWNVSYSVLGIVYNHHGRQSQSPHVHITITIEVNGIKSC